MSSAAPVINTTNYAKSPSGILRILESVFGLIGWSLIASSYRAIAYHQIALFVTITSWITTVISFFVFLFGFHTNLCSGVPWIIIDLVFNTFWAWLYAFAAILIALSTFHVPQMIAGAVVSSIVTVLYIIHVILLFRERTDD